MSWEYLQPVTIRFGAGLVSNIKEAAATLGCTRGMLVSDPFFLKNGLAERIMAENKGALEVLYGEISPNPEVAEIDACAALIRENKIEFVVALGGGSALDCAKAAATICFAEDSIRAYHGTGKELPRQHLPLIAVPTTAGTGSEVTCVAVISDQELGKKGPIVSTGFYPALALIDPELTYTLPAYMTASTGIDVLSHALEGYWSKHHQPICDALALHACEAVFRYLRRACENPQDQEARTRMAEASVMAGLAFTLPKTTASHACSFPLTNLYHIPHGEACSLTLDYFTRINQDADGGRVQDIAVKLGFKDAAALADGILQLKRDIGLRTDLKDLHLTEEQIDELARLSIHPNLYNNPVEITTAMLTKMYRSLA